MNNSRLLKISKYLSRHLRHSPSCIGLQLSPGGWVPVSELLAACQTNNFPVQLAELKKVVAENDKQRFSFDETGTLIRANQGHSVEVDLQLEPAVPPDILYHGTSSTAVESILSQGISKMSRPHVHLSVNIQTARQVGTRHGIPAVFTVDAAAMQREGHTFYCSENKVWLVDFVPPNYLKIS
ncbi:RNA 2'-phosphotransferase [Tychonema sp. LEGE 07203]|uniref:RNA 2'-phosphotransferase n=1 Tax=Tychonema sp. LEGE 07203 TaxID=1828671 RepID=UPI001880A599|nr:RNA 2'-phosphotransferase [Tychonema sp. LEGE 07203]MBE9093111.1 RNA 2'-phosphotransferase [Tychonema sp. LEGE 07203]